MKQIQMQDYGSPDVLKLVETEIPTPNAGEVLVKVKAIGVNYSDILRRKNTYFQETPLPFVLGTEAVGEIVRVGEGVTIPYAVGTTVLAILPQASGYSEYVTAIAQYCVPLPPEMNPEKATAIFVQGTTAQLMISQVANDLEGKTVLVNASAGGVGSILVQLAKLNGAKVIGASSSDAKLEISKKLGADFIVNYSKSEWSNEVKKFTEGKGVDIVFEMVGGEVYNQSLKSLSQGGQIIVFGCASGIQGTIHPEFFVDENITQSGFNLAYFINNRMELWQKALETVIGLLMQDKLKVEIAHKYALEDAAEAHEAIENRKTIGKVILTTNN
ncbi:quinone oxidoreductase family protein [Spongiivirga citrea]|uniref:Zinc-binding dehydrogenase n=1 Tax=Spongiivirga citrea TaxID=1481457 RepID=A0A6M0CI56_9FLAO|nr:zinc-binding dehydrogenase [Spongiivirga citrea]NER17551.1 zinc-binding dehydrogenase [Spongiivirga citrea]